MPRKQQRQQTLTEMVAGQRLAAKHKAKRRRRVPHHSSSTSSEEQEVETDCNKLTYDATSENSVQCLGTNQPHRVATPTEADSNDDNEDYIVASAPNEEVVYPVTLEEFRKYTYCERKVDEIVKEMWETNREIMEEHSKSHEDLHENFLEALYERFYTFPLEVRNKFNLKLKKCSPKVRQRVLARAYIRVLSSSESKNNRLMRNREEKSNTKLQAKGKRVLNQRRNSLREPSESEAAKEAITSRCVGNSDSDSEFESSTLNALEPQNANIKAKDSVGMRNVKSSNVAQQTMNAACRSTTPVPTINNDVESDDNYIVPAELSEFVVYPVTFEEFRRFTNCEDRAIKSIKEMGRTVNQKIDVMREMYERFYIYPLKEREKLNIELRRCPPRLRHKMLGRGVIKQLIRKCNSKSSNIDTIASATTALQVKRKRSFAESTPHKVSEMESDTSDGDIPFVLRRKKCRRTLNVESFNSESHLKSHNGENTSQKADYSSSDTEVFVPQLTIKDNDIQHLATITNENAQSQTLTVENTNQQPLLANNKHSAVSKPLATNHWRQRQTEQYVTIHTGECPPMSCRPQTTTDQSCLEKETILESSNHDKSTELAIKYIEFLKNPNLGTHNQKFPVSLTTFLHTTNCADIVAGIMDELGLEKDDDTLRDRVLKNYYRQFYMNTKIRTAYPLKIKACPKSLKEKILEKPLGEVTYETNSAHMLGLKQKKPQENNSNDIPTDITAQEKISSHKHQSSLDCTTCTKMTELPQKKSSTVETVADSQSLRQQTSQDNNEINNSTDTTVQDTTTSHEHHSMLDCTTGAKLPELLQEESSAVKNAADSQSMPTTKLYDNENNIFLHISAIDECFLLNYIQARVKNVDKCTEILERIRPLLPQLQVKRNGVEILSVLQLKPPEVTAENIVPCVDIEKVKAMFSKDVVFNKTYTFPYLLRYHDGLKRRILSAIVDMNIYEFQRYTCVYNVPDIYNDVKVLQYCYKVTLDREVWPIPLYIRLIDLHKYLQLKNVEYEKLELHDVSPKLLHWDELQQTTDFDDCVRVDYSKCTGQELNDESLLREWREKYYKRCWVQDEWLWRVPKLNEMLARKLCYKKSMAENITEKTPVVTDVSGVAENMEDNIANESSPIATKTVANKSEEPKRITEKCTRDVDGVALTDSNVNTMLHGKSNNDTIRHHNNEAEVIVEDKFEIQMEGDNKHSSNQCTETDIKLGAGAMVIIPRTQAHINALPSKQNVAHDVVLGRNMFSEKGSLGMDDSDILSHTQLHSDIQQTSKVDTKRQDSAPSMKSAVAEIIKQEFVPLHGLQFYLLDDEEHFGCRTLTSEDIVELDTQSQSKFFEEIEQVVTVVSPSDFALDNIQSQFSIESCTSSIPETQPLPSTLEMSKWQKQQVQSESKTGKEMQIQHASKPKAIEHENEGHQEKLVQKISMQQKASNIQEQEPKVHMSTEMIENLKQQKAPQQRQGERVNQQQDTVKSKVTRTETTAEQKVSSTKTAGERTKGETKNARAETILELAVSKCAKATIKTTLTEQPQRQILRDQQQLDKHKQSSSAEQANMPARPKKRLMTKKALPKVCRKDDIVPQLTHEFRPLPLVSRSEVAKLTDTHVPQEEQLANIISLEKNNNEKYENVAVGRVGENVSSQSRPITADAVANENEEHRRKTENDARDVQSIALSDRNGDTVLHNKSNNETVGQHNKEAKILGGEKYVLQMDSDNEVTFALCPESDTELNTSANNFSMVIMPNTQAQIDALPSEQNVSSDSMIGINILNDKDRLTMDNSEMLLHAQLHSDTQQTQKESRQQQESDLSVESSASATIKQELVPLHGLDFYLLNDEEHFICRPVPGDDIIELDTQSPVSNFSEEMEQFVTVVSPSDFAFENMQSQFSIDSYTSSIPEAQSLPSTLGTSQLHIQQFRSESKVGKEMHTEQTSNHPNMIQASYGQEIEKSQQQPEEIVKEQQVQNEQQEQQQELHEQELQKRLQEENLRQPEADQEGGATEQTNTPIQTAKATTSPNVQNRKSTEFHTLPIVSNAEQPDRNVPQETTIVYVPLTINTLSQAFCNDNSLFNNTNLLHILEQQQLQQQAQLQLQQFPEQMASQQHQLVLQQPTHPMSNQQYYILQTGLPASVQQPQATDANAGQQLWHLDIDNNH